MIIFDVVYVSSTLSSLLSTLDITKYNDTMDKAIKVQEEEQ